MEIGRAGCQAAQDRPLELAEIGALAGYRSAAQIGDLENLSRQGGPAAHQTVKTSNPEICKAGGGFTPALAMPMFRGALTEWLPAFGVSWQVPQNPAMLCWLSTSFNPPTPVMFDRDGWARPAVKQVEHDRGEGGTCQIVDPDKEARNLLRERQWAALCARISQEACGIIEDLRGKRPGTRWYAAAKAPGIGGRTPFKGHDLLLLRGGRRRARRAWPSVASTARLNRLGSRPSRMIVRRKPRLAARNGRRYDDTTPVVELCQPGGRIGVAIMGSSTERI